MPPHTHKLTNILLALILISVLFLIALFFYFNSSNFNRFSSGDSHDNFFESQNASLTGEVTAVNGDVLTVRNSKGEDRDFKASDGIIINDFSGDAPDLGGPSADLTKIPIGKQLMMSFRSTENGFEVSSVYVAEAPAAVAAPLPADSTPSATESE